MKVLGSDKGIPVDDIDAVRAQIRTLDAAEAHGTNVTLARSYWCQKAVEWAKQRLVTVQGRLGAILAMM